MADELPDGFDPLRDLQTPFIFVPHGDPEPQAWMAAHPGWARFPAMMVLRGAPQQKPESPPPRGAEPPADRQPGTRWAFSRRPIAPDPYPADPYDPKSPAFDPVRTLQQTGYLPQDLTTLPGHEGPGGGAGAIQQAQLLEPFFEPLTEIPLAKPPEELVPRYMERIPGKSGKEASTDRPSWARGQPRRVGETADQYATRLMDERWGQGKWQGDPERQGDFRQIKKFGSRAFRDPSSVVPAAPEYENGV